MGLDYGFANLLHQLLHLLTPTCSIHLYIMMFAEEPFVLVKCITGVLCSIVYVVWPLYLISTGFWTCGPQSVSVSIIVKLHKVAPSPPTQHTPLLRVCPLLAMKDCHHYVKKNKFCFGLLTLLRKRFAGDYSGKHYPPSLNNNPLPVA